MPAAGIDVGSITDEALLFDKEKGLIDYGIMNAWAGGRHRCRG
jgi:hypothetical protein